MSLDNGAWLCSVYSMQSARSYAVERVREWVLDGTLTDGSRINEGAIAKALAISRTPLREALFDLSADGYIESIERRGFFVRPLSLVEFEGLYDIRPILDPQALRLGGIPDPRTIDKLVDLDERLAKATTPTEIVDADDAFHLTLISGCPNSVLIDLIEQMMRRTRRFEMALFREVEQLPRAKREHERLIDHLRARDLNGALAALVDNLSSGKAPIRHWLIQRIGKQK